MSDYRQTARERMKGSCRLCRVCDGRACAGEMPGMGGIGTGASFRANVQALARLKFNLRAMHGVTAPDTRQELLGLSLALPVLAAPIAAVHLSLGGGLPEVEYDRAVLRGSRAAGVVGCLGDGVAPELYDAGMTALREVEGRGIPFVKPWADDAVYANLARAREAGATVAGMDIDSGGRKRTRAMVPQPPARLREIVARAGLKFVLKGVMTPDEARLAVQVGADAIVVSNHGGRVLDSTPGAAEVLPAVARAVAGRIPVLADGGVRSGGDVLKLLALGADAVLVGRPVAVAAMGGGEEAVRDCLLRLGEELVAAMILTGAASVTGVDPGILWRGPRAAAPGADD